MRSIFCVTVFLLYFIIPNNGKHHKQSEIVDFVLESTEGKEKVIRISRHGILVAQTELPSFGETGLFLRQLYDGEKMLQMIYAGKGNLSDCDISKEKHDVEAFVTKFYDHKLLKDLKRDSKHPTLTLLDQHSAVDRDIRKMTNYHALSKECRQFHQEMDYFYKNSQKPKSGRAKRNTLMYPGTKWCGRGNTAKEFHDLGDSVDTDKCCRAHDHCPYTISAFSKKFGMFNYRYYTVSHCDCDERLRGCLKHANSAISDMVGKMYFNVISMKCFTMRKKRACKKKSWWGKCQKYGTRYKAYIREPRQY